MSDPSPPDHTPAESAIEARGHVTPAPSSSDTEAASPGQPAIAPHGPAVDMENLDPGLVDFARTTDLSPKRAAEPAPARATPSDEVAAQDQPTAFGRYEVRHALGAGGFGSVY